MPWQPDGDAGQGVGGTGRASSRDQPRRPPARRSRTAVANGTRVSRHGTVSFTRSGFARVRWDDGTVSADLIVEREARAAGTGA